MLWAIKLSDSSIVRGRSSLIDRSALSEREFHRVPLSIESYRFTFIVAVRLSVVAFGRVGTLSEHKRFPWREFDLLL